MEMDWKTFIAKLVHALAWPGVVVFVIFLLRDKLGDLIPRIKRFKHKDTELEFTEGITELAQERKAAGVDIQQVPRTDEYQNQYQFLIRLGELSPRSAVIEAFRLLESAAAKKVARVYPNLPPEMQKSPLQLQKMLKGEVLAADEFYQFNQLRKLRNEAAHTEDFSVRGMPLEAYIDIALSLAARLDEVEP